MVRALSDASLLQHTCTTGAVKNPTAPKRKFAHASLTWQALKEDGTAYPFMLTPSTHEPRWCCSWLQVKTADRALLVQ